jgi:hypothetical protein
MLQLTRDRITYLADPLCRTLIKANHRVLRISLVGIEIKHVLKAGLISRQSGVPRSIAALIESSALTKLNPRAAQPAKITMTRYLRPAFVCVESPASSPASLRSNAGVSTLFV